MKNLNHNLNQEKIALTADSLITFYTEYMLIMSKNEAIIEEIKLELERSYEIKGLGRICRFLGMGLCQFDNDYKVSLEDDP